MYYPEQKNYLKIIKILGVGSHDMHIETRFLNFAKKNFSIKKQVFSILKVIKLCLCHYFKSTFGKMAINAHIMCFF